MDLESNEESARQKALGAELEWIRASPKARQAKSKARIKAYDELLAKANDQVADGTKIIIPAPPRLGGVVLEAEHLNKGFADRMLIDNLSFRLPPGGIVGVVGPNGAGQKPPCSA